MRKNITWTESISEDTLSEVCHSANVTGGELKTDDRASGDHVDAILRHQILVQRDKESCLFTPRRSESSRIALFFAQSCIVPWIRRSLDTESRKSSASYRRIRKALDVVHLYILNHCILPYVHCSDLKRDVVQESLDAVIQCLYTSEKSA